MFRHLNIAIIFIIISSCIIGQDKKILYFEYDYKKLPFGLVEKVPKYQPDISLILSGGGARGVAQIGVLRALNERNIPISRIIGTSMGSIIGGLYAAGYSVDVLDSLVKEIPWDELLTIKNESSRKDLFIDQKITEDKALFALRLDGLNPILPTSINTGELLSNYLNLLVLNAPIHANSSFDELKLKFQAVCTDLVTGKIVVLDKGSLSQAMRASSSISLFVSPVKMDTLLLVDGGLVANIPVKLAKDLGSDYIIAFNTTSPLNSFDELSNPWNVADQLVSIPIRLLSIQQLEYADEVIEPNLGKKKNNDFTNLDSMIIVGYNSTLSHLDEIEQRVTAIFKNKIKEKEFFIKNVVYNENAEEFERPFLLKYSRQDSVSSYQLYSDMYEIYKQGKFKNIIVEVTPENNLTNIKFLVKENPRIKFLETEGITLFEDQIVDSIFSDLKDKPFNSVELFNKLCEILNLYRSSGYSLADVDWVNFDEETGILNLKFSEGIISKIEIQGNIKTSTSLIRREIPVEEGDFFLYNKLKNGFSNLRSTNLFEDINFAIKNLGVNKNLVIKVLEKPSSLVRFGLRIDNENQTQLRMDVRDENIAGTGTELGLILNGGIRNRSFMLEHKANRIFNTYLTYNVRAYYEFNDVFTYKTDTSKSSRKFSRSVSGEYRQIFGGLSIGIGTQVQRFGNIIFESKYQRDEVKNRSNFREPYKINIFSLQLLSTIDSQDKYPYPNGGFYIKSFYETAQKFFGGDVSYTKFYFDYQSYFALGKNHTIKPRFVLGFADQTLPLSQQFSLGGQNLFFGLRDYEYRGRQIFLSSIQYRIKSPVKIFFDTYFQFRYDLGSIWDTKESIRFKDLRHGTGITLSFDTPLGPADFSAGRSFIFNGIFDYKKIAWGPVYFYFTIGYYY